MMHRSLICGGATLLAASSSIARCVSAASSAAKSIPDVLPSEGKALFQWWDVLTRGTHGDAYMLLDPRWWFHYIVREFDAEPAHVIVETACILTILYLLVWRKPAPLDPGKLTRKEEDELIAEWKPEPLCPTWQPVVKTRYIVESVTGRNIVANGANYLNFASTNFLGLADKEEVKVACRATIEKYGVGSCGPRGFYGTFDLHLEIEAALAKFMQAEECILYSDAIASVSSVIPAFAKKGDTIVVDDSVNFGIQQGCLLSRSTIYYYKHNDLVDLERVLKEVQKKEIKNQHQRKAMHHRKFIICEGISSIYGDIVPLPEILQLKQKYSYRLIVDDSLGFGVLGEKGRGVIEHYDVEIQGSHDADVDAPAVDILCATMDGALASVGGFCVGSHQVVDHQRLSGAGYCFSASSPPYTSSASLVTLQMIEDQSNLSGSLRKKAQKLRKALVSVHRELQVLGSVASEISPVIHIGFKSTTPAKYVEQRGVFEKISSILQEESKIIVSVPEFIPADKCAAVPTLRILLTNLHTDADIEKLTKAVSQAANKAIR